MHISKLPLILILALIFAFDQHTTLVSSSSIQVSVLTQHNDNQRTGANLNETLLTTSSVKPGYFGKLFTQQVDGAVYAQPLYVSGVNIPNQGSHNVVFVATQHNSVYAFDADDATASAPLWQINLGPSAPTPADFGNRFGPYTDIQVEVGITGTPVIDPLSGTLYVVTFVREPESPPTCATTGNCIYHHYLHALDIATHVEKFGGPIRIAGSIQGTGVDNVNGVITFNSHQQLQRAALLLSKGVVYIAFGGYADTNPYHGWLFGYSAATLQLASIFNTTPDAHGSSTDGAGAIWQSGEGPSADTEGNIYVITGNGNFTVNNGGRDRGDSFLKLDPVPPAGPGGWLSVLDWFTPYNQDYMNGTDTDLGSTGVLIIPGTNYLVGGGKQGVLYMVDKTNMTHFNLGGPDLVQDYFQASVGQIHSSPITWNSPSGTLVYIWSVKDRLKAFRFDGSHLIHTPVAVGSTLLAPQGFPAGSLSLSANGSVPGSGIVWAAHPVADIEPSPSTGILRAYDAADITKELWNSTLLPSDAAGSHTKFNAPTIANGKVYLGTASKQLIVYGLFQNSHISLPVVGR